MSRRRKILLGIYIAVGAVLACLLVSFYTGRLNFVISQTTYRYMSELAEHDMKSIQWSIRSFWMELENAGERLGLFSGDGTDDLMSRMKVEEGTGTFDEIYLVDDKGNSYDCNFHVSPGMAGGVLERIGKSGGGTVSYITSYQYEDYHNGERTLAYVTSIPPFTEDGIRFVGLVGTGGVERLQARLNVESFGGAGYSIVIDENGNLIGSTTGTRQDENQFERFRLGEFANGATADEVIGRILSDERLEAKYVTPEGEAEFLTVVPIDGTEWYLLMMIPESVNTAQTRTFIRMTTVIMAGMMGIFLALTVFIAVYAYMAVKAKAEAKIKGDFLSNMSHEIRTPLNGIIGLNHLMQKDMDDKEKLAGYLKKSGQAASYLLSLINDILDFSKLQEGKMEMIRRPFSLGRLIDSVLSMTRESMEAKGIELIVENRASGDILLGDEMRIQQILLNIISNAVKFTQKGGSIRFFAAQSREDGVFLTKLVIADTGCGMSEEFQRHLFDAFSQEQRREAGKSAGTGLGMAITRLLVERMGGTIFVESKENVGSTFTVCLPLEAGSEEELEKELKAELPEKPLERKVTILAAEDNELNAEILSEILKMNGCTPVMAKNGKEALDLFAASENGAYDLILMDLQMPVMNGFESAKAIRALPRPDAKTVKIIACTANTFSEDIDRIRESGMDSFVAKPIDVKKLLEEIRKYVEGKDKI